MSDDSINNNVINYPFIDYIIKCYIPNFIIEKVNMGLFRQALTHDSVKKKNYERLEYLGDAVFHLILTEYLYKRYDEENEGFLTRLRIRIERGDSMAELTKILRLDNFIQTHSYSINENIMEDVFESFIGAFYLNFGINSTRDFIFSLIEKHKDLSELILYDDNYKDLLLRYFHQMKWGHPKYLIDKKNINVKNEYNILVKNPNGEILGKGRSNFKKKAEQIASKNALINLGVIINGEIDPEWIHKIDKIEKDSNDKIKLDKKRISVYNDDNILITRTNVNEILLKYNIVLPKQYVIRIKNFREAMTHRSYIQRNKKLDPECEIPKKCVKLQKKSNERLQFIGDAVMHFIVGEDLYYKYPLADEGFMTRLRCKIENRDSVYILAKKTEIAKYILVSKNIEMLHGRNNVNIGSSGFDAFIGILYLEFGFQTVKNFVLEVLRVEINISKLAEKETNYKDLILHLYNKNRWGKPEYRILSEEGPDHCKIFTIGIYLNNKLVGKGVAPSKKKAEQIASKIMYDKINK